MAFYEDLNKYYDRIFPLNKAALDFITNYIREGQSILDMGAGTGNLAIALAEKGYEVTASEPEKAMAEAIRNKASEKNLSVVVHTKFMEQVDELEGHFNAIVCVGNTLPHLQNLEAVDSYLEKCYSKLSEDGKLIIQQVNYDKVLASDDFSFPVIEKEDFTFTRHYEKSGDHILFTSRLTINGETKENTITLHPFTSSQLKNSLVKAGFQTIQLFGNFKGEEYTINAPALVVVAEK